MSTNMLLPSLIFSLTLANAQATHVVPLAKELDEILTRVLNRPEFESSVFSYLFGNHTEPPNDINIQHLDISILDLESIRKIINTVEKSYYANETYRRRELLTQNEVFVAKAFDLMKQAIYSTRYRMLETKPYRNKYKNDFGYNIAIMFGALMQIRMKMENMYATMDKLPHKTHFLWYLVLYEKILACYVDVEDLVEKTFVYHDKWLTKIKEQKAKTATPIPPRLQTLTTQ
ncbi:uncharacterized protein LOC116413439 [Galleria mellonella]|uniref:Uncharacterized protein LOC116413439 n=1 Tax=Galleria mellonella TaxID=7137 RepID=A0A6J3CBP6_GALME|nr:uncharacterized protein LOC116413439 [Galleria mellonella]